MTAKMFDCTAVVLNFGEPHKMHSEETKLAILAAFVEEMCAGYGDQIIAVEIRVDRAEVCFVFRDRMDANVVALAHRKAINEYRRERNAGQN